MFNTQSSVLQADWLELENNEKATLNINMPYYLLSIKIIQAKVRYNINQFQGSCRRRGAQGCIY